MYRITEISKKEDWEGFLFNSKEKTFLISWNWGEFQKSMGSKVWRLAILNKEELIGEAQVIKVMAKRGGFLLVPHGPVLKSESLSGEILKTILDYLRTIAVKEKTSFIRFSPICQDNKENQKLFKDLGFKEAPLHVHPELTWELDISLPEEEILKKMRKTTRYLIRQAEKNKDIEIIKSENLEALEDFNKIYKETVKRHHFVPFPVDYLEKEITAFKSDGQIVVFLGKHQGQVVSGAIIVFWQGIGFYHHGASWQKYSKTPVSYLLQWEAIKEAKKRGCIIYNFWGIAPENKKNHPWAGLTLFKQGFGGNSKQYLKTQDLPLFFNYRLNYLIETVRRIKRGL